MAKRGRRKEKKGGGILSTLVLVVALAVFCYAGYQLIKIYFEYKVGVDEYGALAEEFATTEKETEGFVEEQMAENETMGEDEWNDITLADTRQLTVKPLEKMENPIDFTSLRSINHDIIGWLEMEALDISYPIVQGKDNDFYLHHTFRGEYNFAGSIFLDYLNKPPFMQRNTIVYGHNMRIGTMFGLLRRYSEQETYDKSPYFWIYTPTKIYKYEIFAASVVGTYSDSYKITFANAKEFLDFVDAGKSQSAVKTDVDVGAVDTVVTLSTCTGDYSTRFIVQGKRVRTYESVEKEGGYAPLEETLNE